MDPLTEIKSLVGRTVTFKRIAGNSLILYFNGRPGDPDVKSVWLDPSWRYEYKGQIATTSEDLPWESEKGESDASFSRRFARICNKTNPLVKAKLVKIEIGSNSQEIRLSFSGFQIIRTVVNSRSLDSWVYRNGTQNLSIVPSHTRYLTIRKMKKPWLNGSKKKTD